MTRLRKLSFAGAVVVLAVSALGLQAPGSAAVPETSPAATSAANLAKAAATATTGTTGAVTKTKTVTREMFDADGNSQVVDQNKVTLNVSATTNLRGRQELNVTWSGAHPTGGLVGDVNSAAGTNEEYPFILMECRGVDSNSVATSKRISPQTCWTQTSSERFVSDYNTSYPAWRSDAFATPDERAKYAGQPSPRPSACGSAALSEHWLPFVAEDGTKYAGGSVGCAGVAPESSDISGSGLPSNTTYGITGTNGRGSVQFSVWTEDENASLGCSSTVKCTLVAIPVEGVSCDGYGTQEPAADRPDTDAHAAVADQNCRAADAYAPGANAVAGTVSNEATSGELWWAASNWRNRISVPLAFAVSPNVCSVVSSAKPLTIYGSSLLNEATAQWQPKFCTDDKLFPFIHVQTADSAARTLVQGGSIEAAFSSRAPDGGFTKPVVQAPVAMTGFAIGYVIDDANGQRYTKLRLDARLLAKLLTESYPGDALVRDNHAGIGANPMTITTDPEFIALNPGLPQYTSREAAAVLLTLSSDADMVYAMTSYINSDPDARAFLDGKADPWGMVVNPSYKGISLPVYSWPLLDNFTAPPAYIQGGNNPCYSYSPGPWMQLMADPTALISTIVLNMQYAISNVQLSCPNGNPEDISTLKLSTEGRQNPGHRFVMGIVPLSSVSRYGLTAAALHAGPDASTAGDSASRAAAAVSGTSYVSGDDAGLSAAATLLTRDKAAKTWSVDYDKLRSAKGTTAYPGTLPVFADVPTSGLPKKDAANLATFLNYVATTGQTRGLLNGELPPGYLPLTKANGLADFAGYTVRAAAAVKAQKGFVPSLNPADDVVAGGKGDGSTANSGDGGDGATPNAPSTPAPGTKTPTANAGQSPVAVAFKTAGDHSVLGNVGVPLAILLALVLGFAGGLLRFSGELRTAAAAGRTAFRRASPGAGPGGRRRKP
ncbi:MAG TPA: hypothetical protein VHZ06_01110 [Marmoricola sp.]|nr:hypothetical protein [Marmoricola sp.]